VQRSRSLGRRITEASKGHRDLVQQDHRPQRQRQAGTAGDAGLSLGCQSVKQAERSARGVVDKAAARLCLLVFQFVPGRSGRCSGGFGGGRLAVLRIFAVSIVALA